MKAIIPVVMAGIIAIYGLVVAVVLKGECASLNDPPDVNTINNWYSPNKWVITLRSEIIRGLWQLSECFFEITIFVCKNHQCTAIDILVANITMIKKWNKFYSSGRFEIVFFSLYSSRQYSHVDVIVSATKWIKTIAYSISTGKNRILKLNYSKCQEQ